MATSTTPAKLRRRPGRVIAAALGLALTVAACSSGPGSEEDLVTSLTRDDSFTTAEAVCIASAIFSEYGTDEEALGKISGAGNFEELSGTEGVPGFDTFFRNTVAGCTNT